MFEFYEFNTFNICVVLISTFVIYYILSNILRETNKEKENNEFSIEYLMISVLISIGISLGVSYIMTSKDEALLNDNYWENNSLE
jgi:hypothetical protein